MDPVSPKHEFLSHAPTMLLGKSKDLKYAGMTAAERRKSAAQELAAQEALAAEEYGVQSGRRTSGDLRAAGAQALEALEAAQRRVKGRPRMPPEETSSLSVGVPPRSIAHLDPVRFMSQDDERAAASGEAFALGERAPVVSPGEPRPTLAARELYASEEIDLPPIPGTPPALGAQLGRGGPTGWTEGRAVAIPKDLRYRYNARREGWWGWHLVDGFVQDVDAGSPCEQLGITVGSIVRDWEPKLCPEGFPCWPIGPGTTAAEKVVLDVSPHGHVLDQQLDSWTQPWLSKVKSRSDGDSNATGKLSTAHRKTTKNDNMTTISDIIHAAASNQDRPMMRFRNMENFDKSFLDRKFDESDAFSRAVNLHFDERVANDPATKWCNAKFGFRILSVKELQTAIPYLCIIDAMFPGRVALTEVANLNPLTPKEISENWVQLRTTWFEKHIHEEAIIAVDFRDLEQPPIQVEAHMDFLTSLMRLYLAKHKLCGSLHKPLESHDPLERRRGLKVASWIKEVPRFSDTKELARRKAEKKLNEIMDYYAERRAQKGKEALRDRVSASAHNHDDGRLTIDLLHDSAHLPSDLQAAPSPKGHQGQVASDFMTSRQSHQQHHNQHAHRNLRASKGPKGGGEGDMDGEFNFQTSGV